MDPQQIAAYAQSKYRRGAILGLTVAEIFILLMFLLMLILLVLDWAEEKRREQQQQELLGLQQFQDTWAETLAEAGIQTPDDILILERWREDFVSLGAGNQPGDLLVLVNRAERQRDAAQADSAGKQAQIEEQQAQVEEQQAQIEEQQEQLAELQQQNEQLSAVSTVERGLHLLAELADRQAQVEEQQAQVEEQQAQIERQQAQLAELQRQNERLSASSATEGDQQALAELADSQAQIEEQQAQIEEQQAQLAELQQQNEQLSALAREQRILLEKGLNPPCWYEVVPAPVIPFGGAREKAHYLFNIEVFDTHMVVLPRPIPPGGAINDNEKTYDTYAEEAALLPLEQIPYGQPLGDAEMLDYLRPIREAGKESRIRSYSCVFSVQIRDETSDSAKQRWKQAHYNILEYLFGTYVRRDPWDDAVSPVP